MFTFRASGVRLWRSNHLPQQRVRPGALPQRTSERWSPCLGVGVARHPGLGRPERRGVRGARVGHCTRRAALPTGRSDQCLFGGRPRYSVATRPLQGSPGRPVAGSHIRLGRFQPRQVAGRRALLLSVSEPVPIVSILAHHDGTDKFFNSLASLEAEPIGASALRRQAGDHKVFWSRIDIRLP